MPAPYGITENGFSSPTFEELRDAMYERFRNRFGSTPSDKTIEGQFIAIVCERLVEAWEVLETVFESFDPDSASGTLLKNAALLVGTFAQADRASTVQLTWVGDDGTVVPAGTRGANPATDDKFASTELATLSDLTAWANTTAYVIGDQRSNSSRSYVCITSGTSAGSGGPTTTDPDITDGTVHWRYMGEGTAAADAPAECTVTGPVIAVSGSITDIDTPVGGLNSVINLLDADVGADADEDADIRLRRDADLARLGSTPIDALRSELLDLEGVTSVRIFQNVTDDDLEIDPVGPVLLPPHSVEALVVGGDDQEIVDALGHGVAAGIQTFGFAGGLVTGTFVDSEGNGIPIEFARPDPVLIYVAVDLEYDDDEYPTDGDAQVKLAIVTYGDAQKPGRDVEHSALEAQVFTIPGVLRCTVTVGTAPSPVDPSVTIGAHELAVYDTSRIDVTSAAGEP